MELGSGSDGRRNTAEDKVWHLAATMFRWRRFIVGVTAAVAIAAVVVSLLLPKTYLASSRLLIPEGGSGGLVGMLGNLPSAARSLLGSSGGGDFTRYIAILSSRSVRQRVVEEFDLLAAYGLEDEPHPMEAAIRQLDENVSFVVDPKFDYLSVEVLDSDPERAADIANYFVAELNRVNSSLASQSAAHLRKYIGARYDESLAQLDSIEFAMQSFRERHGVFELDTQMESFYTQLVEMRVAQLQSEALYETTVRQFGEDNQQALAYRNAAEVARAQYERALAGQERLMPVPQGEVPSVVRQYVTLERERLIQTTILEAIAPMLEQARLEEQRDREAVQVVDLAVPPVRKAYPKRMIIVASATMSAFLLCVFFVFAFEWWRRNHAVYARRMRAAVEDEQRVVADA